MKRSLTIAVLGAFALGGSLVGLALDAGAASVPHLAVGEMRTVLLDGAQMPAVPTTTTTMPPPPPTTTTTTTAPQAITEPTTTTTTTVAPAQPGPQPYSPGVTVQVTTCAVTWTETETNPDPLPQDSATYTVQEGYDGDCAMAAQVAAQHPGSTVQQVTDPVTTGQSELPGS